MYRIALALVLVATSGFVHSRDDRAAEALEGAWLVNVANQPRERFLMVSGAYSHLGWVRVTRAVWGWIDGGSKQVQQWNAEIAGDTIRLSFLSPSDSLVKVVFKMGAPMVTGTMLTPDGRSLEVRMTRLPIEEMAALRGATAVTKNPELQKAVADRNAKLRLLYIGGKNCIFCNRYESEYNRAGRTKQLLGAASDEVEYVSIRLDNYYDAVTVADLPEELKWLLAKDAAGNTPLRRRGNPYFAALCGNSILVQGHGEIALHTLVAPALKYAVETRRGSK